MAGAALRSWSFALLLGALALACGARSTAAPKKGDAQTIYRYVNAKGRTVFVNGRDRLPKRYRRRAKPVDLSKVSLNEQLAVELELSVDQQLERMLASGRCSDLRAQADGGFFGTLWQRHGHLLLIGLAILALLAATPYLSRTIGAPRWGRMLMIAIGLLGMLALISSAAVRTQSFLASSTEKARACRPLPRAERPRTPLERQNRFDQLQRLLRAEGVK